MWLLFASLLFYGWWDARSLPIILSSLGVNYMIGAILSRGQRGSRFTIVMLIGGITFNLTLLGIFKYADFILATVNAWTHATIRLPGWELPLGISFFTFTQIAFLVDAYRGQARETKWGHYSLFVTFFPHLLAGPIVHHRPIMEQFDQSENYRIQYPNIFLGLFYFLSGLFQKLVFADFAGPIADAGFLHVSNLSFVEAWVALLAYTMQIYFDFAGYSNMAIGIALFFNIRFPVNFLSPYQSVSIIEFWRRWHITLSTFLKDYLYIPLGGNKQGEVRRYLNIFLTMLLGGIWHGAGWTFMIWGAYHGVLIVVNHAVRAMNLRIPRSLSLMITFLAVCYGWVFFRSRDLAQAIGMTSALAGFQGIHWGWFPFVRKIEILGVLALAVIALCCPNSEFWAKKIHANIRWLFLFLIVWMIVLMMMNRTSAFLYFQF